MAGGYVRVWADIAQAKRCRWCRKPIVLRTTAGSGKTIAFDAGLTSLGITRDEVTQIRFETLRWDDAHKCPNKPKAPRRQKPERFPPRAPQREFGF